MAFKENSVEIPPMNRNINILGMHYVNPHFSGVLDKINESKEQALKVTGEVFFCVLCPSKSWCRARSPGGWRSSGTHGGNLLGIAWHGQIKTRIARARANQTCVLKQIFGEGPAWPLANTFKYFSLTDNELSRRRLVSR